MLDHSFYGEEDSVKSLQMAYLQDETSRLRQGDQLIGLLKRACDGFFEKDIDSLKEEISGNGVVKGSGNGNADGLDFTEEIRMTGEGLNRVSFCNLPATGRIDIDHPHAFHTFHV